MPFILLILGIPFLFCSPPFEGKHYSNAHGHKMFFEQFHSFRTLYSCSFFAMIELFLYSTFTFIFQVNM